MTTVAAFPFTLIDDVRLRKRLSNVVDISSPALRVPTRLVAENRQRLRFLHTDVEADTVHLLCDDELYDSLGVLRDSLCCCHYELLLVERGIGTFL
jgi:hypothetical protein